MKLQNLDMKDIDANENAEPLIGFTTVSNTHLEDPAQIKSLRTLIDTKLHEDDVYQQIRDLVLSKTKCRRDQDEESTDNNEDEEDKLIRELLHSDVVQQLLVAVKQSKKDTRKSDNNVVDVDNDTQSTDPVIYLRLAGGRAFIDHLSAESEHDDVIDSSRLAVGSVRQFFRVIITFQGQRLHSRDVICSVDPVFDDHLRFHLKPKRKRMHPSSSRGSLDDVDILAPWEALCLVTEPIHIVLLKVTKERVVESTQVPSSWKDVSCELVATHSLDWRRALSSTLPFVSFPVSLVDTMKVPVGTLDLRVDIVHVKRTTAMAREVKAYLEKETLMWNTRYRALFRHTKEWWEEYNAETKALEANSKSLEEQSSFQHGPTRLVKLFAEDEDDHRFRFVSSYLTPLRVPFAVRSPCEAARFVSLIPYETNVAASSGQRSNISGLDEPWRSLPTFLAVGKGDVQAHVILLASLLLGCGLDAYVCIGSIKATTSQSKQTHWSTNDANVGHMWVLTRSDDSGNDVNNIVFWEAITGERFHIPCNDSVKSLHGYQSVDCVFSATHFYGNLQSKSVGLGSFEFENKTLWKSISPRWIHEIPDTQSTITIKPPDVSQCISLEQSWINDLRHTLSSQRRANGLTTIWCDTLCHYLQPALHMYEMERLYGKNAYLMEKDLFEQSIKRFVRDGYTFQGVPLVFTSLWPQDAHATLVSNQKVQSLLQIQGRHAQFGLAVRCIPYPDNCFVIWLMFAASYQSNESK